MFADPRHIPDDMESNDDDENDHLEGDDGIMNMEQNDLPMGAIVGSNDTINQPQWKGLLHNWPLQCKRSQMNVKKVM
jgi:hypothetical protein